MRFAGVNDLMRKDLLREWLPLLLVWSCLVLQPASRWSELPMALMALGGIVIAVRRGRAIFQYREVRYLAAVFLLCWIPVLLSLPDAVNLSKAMAVALPFPRLFFAGLFTLWALGTSRARERFLRLCAWTVLFWIGDSLLQAFAGVEIFGYRYNGVRLSGIFGRYPLKLGWFIAIFSPLVLLYARRYWHPLAQLSIFCGLLIVLLLAVSRAGWIAFGVILVAYGLFILRDNRRVALQVASLCLVLTLGTVAGAYTLSPGFRASVQKSLFVLKGDAESVNFAITWRLPIWRTAMEMIRENPFNGVGARGYRYAYTAYAAPEDFIVEPGSPVPGAYHAHQILLELASETGVPGLLGWVLAMGLLVRFWLQSTRETRSAMLPFALPLLGAFFPLNTHFAFYSSSWSLVLFWFMALFFAAAQQREEVSWSRRESVPSGVYAEKN